MAAGFPAIRRGMLIAAALALPLTAAEFAARQILPVTPGSDSYARNPHRYRGWPEYIRAIENREPDTAHCVLLTNCQGYGGEYHQNLIYAAELGKRLRAIHAGGITNWVVHNWAVDGATSMDYLFMAAKLVEHPPHVVIALTGHADYRSEHFNEKLGYTRTDLPRLLADRKITKNLPPTFLARHASIENRIAFPLRHRLALLRLPEFAWSWMERRTGGVFVNCYAPNMGFMPWRLPNRRWGRPIEHPQPASPEPPITYDHRSRKMLSEYLDTLERIDAPWRIVVMQPYEYANEPAVNQTAADAGELCAERNLIFWDWRTALPLDGFITSAHFSRGHHVRMAHLLADRLSEQMRGD